MRCRYRPAEEVLVSSMTTQFDSNTFEHDYIVAALNNLVTELETDRPESQTIDKYAVQLTAFMNGQILQAVNHAKTTSD